MPAETLVLGAAATAGVAWALAAGVWRVPAAARPSPGADLVGRIGAPGAGAPPLPPGASLAEAIGPVGRSALQLALLAAVAAAYLLTAHPCVRSRLAQWVGRPAAPGAPPLVRALALPALLWAVIALWATVEGPPLGAGVYAVAYGLVLLAPPLLARAPPVRDAVGVLARGAVPDAPALPSAPLSDPAARAPLRESAPAPPPRSAARWGLLAVAGLALPLWLAVELRWLPPLPRLGAVGVPLTKFVTIVQGVWLFLVVLGWPRAGYGAAIPRGAWWPALLAFAAFAAVALPVGFALRFLTWNPRADLGLWLLRPPLIYFTIALPEEFLFRGLLQRALALTFVPRFGARAGTRGALTAAALVFGLAHAPSPAYMALATLAGLAYGAVYVRTGRVAAAALTHTLVDAVWVLLFRR